MIKNILWDFDGVILDSMPIREYAFREIFKEFNKNLVEDLILYHNYNGGLSRFDKIKYFYNTLLKKEISEKEIEHYAKKFSGIVISELVNHKYIITDSVDFIKNNFKDFNFHIVSGSEHNELNYLCKKLDLDKYFLSINGSPTHKNKLVENLIQKYEYNKIETVLIGDSINDFEAAKVNEIQFLGYNNLQLSNLGKYIDSFEKTNSNIFN